MANGHVEIHDPFLNHRDPERTSDSDGMEDSVELRLMMAYARRRRRPQRGGASPLLTLPSFGIKGVSGALSPLQTPDKAEKEEEEEEIKKRRMKKKKKRRLSMKGWRRNIFSCIKPQTDDEELRQKIAEGADAEGADADDRCGPLRGGEEALDLINVILKSSY